ncbi:MAG: DmsE family decaheme c-type cytochrome [Pseudomonadota bacterium]
MMKKRVLSFSPVFFLFIFVLLMGVQSEGDAEEKTGDTGANVCADCHEETYKSYVMSRHGVTADARTPAAKQGCESCHGPTDKHVDDPSKQSIISFSKDGGRAAEELSKQCLGCHSNSSHLAQWDMSQHSRNDVTCGNCHTVHAPRARAAVKQPLVCFECHKSIQVDVRKQSHHPIMEGKVSCSSCHNPHGELSRAMIKAENTNQLCYQCHADKRGPYVWQHLPVEENCATCHTPHGSRYDKLLTQRLTNLCQDCHANSGHHDNPYDATGAFIGSSPSSRFYARSCLNCHSMIHGSSYFQRTGLTR